MINNKLIIVIYLMLTFIKFFTAEIYTQREEDPTIYFKYYPTISNVFLGSDIHHEEYRKAYKWFAKGNYWEIAHGNSSNVLSYLYKSIILLWWILSLCILVYITIQVLK